MAFYQSPPALANQLDDDRVLVSYLTRVLPPDVLAAAMPTLRELGALAGDRFYKLQLEDRLNEPTLTQWDAWGKRVDRIEVTALWKEAAKVAAEHGVVATAYDRPWGRFARVVQMASVYLFHPSTDVYTCPLAMTDGAARTLLAHGNRALIDRAVPRLTSRDPAFAWTSGQWMTERTGGSDVGISETIAKRTIEDGRETFRLYGTKWFTSATTSQVALTLARPEGNPAGGRGLALFYVEPWLADGSANQLLVNRLKDKLGTRKVPTAELSLEGTVATPVAGLDAGVRNITPMLNVTRTWNAVAGAGDMRRGVALARDYATRREAFGAKLADKPLHRETLAGLQAELEAAFAFSFFAVELLGKVEAGEATETDQILLRMATPSVKATIGKQAMPLASEVLECFGGAGYVEDTGLPRLLRDMQVGPIWEGTTNVLSLDLLRAIGTDGAGARVWREEIARRVRDCNAELRAPAEAALRAVDHGLAWLAETAPLGRDAVEAGARGLLLTLGRAMALALVIEGASVSLASGDGRAAAAARRLVRHGIDQIGASPPADAAILAAG